MEYGKEMEYIYNNGARLKVFTVKNLAQVRVLLL